MTSLAHASHGVVLPDLGGVRLVGVPVEEWHGSSSGPGSFDRGVPMALLGCASRPQPMSSAPSIDCLKPLTTIEARPEPAGPNGS